MRLTFVGCGSAFNMTDYQSNMLVEVDEAVPCPPAESGAQPGTQLGTQFGIKSVKRRMLLDCGMTAPLALADLKVTTGEIDALYISHQHADHIGGIEWLAFTRFFTPGSTRPLMFVNESLADDLWEHSLKGGLASIEGRICTMETYFDVRKVPMNDSFLFGGVSFTPIQTVHIMNGFGIVPSYGLIFKSPAGKSVFVTTDTQFTPYQLARFYKEADVIFQDAETSKFKSGVHAHYTDLKTLAPEIRRKMWLYHFQPGELPDAKADGFAGFVRRGQAFEL